MDTNAIIAIEKKVIVTCPRCSEPYRIGEALIMLVLSGKRWWIGQGVEEEYSCISCHQLVRADGGTNDDKFLAAVFPTLRDAEQEVLRLAALLTSSPEEFRRSVVVIPIEEIEGVNYQ